jgi:hypothetical protein
MFSLQSILATKMLSRQHDLAEGPNPPRSAPPAGFAAAPRPHPIGPVFGWCAVIAAIVLAGVGAPGLSFVLVLFAVLDTAIPLGLMMFHLPPRQCEPHAVAAPDRVG